MREKNTFELNFDTATAQFMKLGNRPLNGLEAANIFFDGILKQPIILKEYTHNASLKNAIILLGQSCTGKSSFAKEFIKSHPEYEYLSLDDCALKELLSTNVIHCYDFNILNNSLGFKEFGSRLESGKNLIIDGCWLHINVRSALLKTLRELGYVTCAFSFFNIPPHIHEERVVSRVISNVARDALFEEFTLEEVDYVSKYASKHKISYEEAISKIHNSNSFSKEFNKEIARLIEEAESSVLNFQIKTGFIYISFDSIYLVNF